MTHNEMPSILDKQVDSKKNDLFGHRHFAKALRSLIEDKVHTPPYTIGLLGTWGTGKSTIKQIYLTDLNSDLSKENGVRRCDRILKIEFNAWRHGGTDDIKKALLRKVFVALGGNDEDLTKEFYTQIQKQSQERKPYKDFWMDVGEKWLIPAAAWFIVFLVISFFSYWIVIYLEIDYAVFPITTSVLVAGYLFKNVFNIKFQPLSRYTPVTMLRAPSTTAEQYEKLLLNQIKIFKNNTRGKNCQRVVVFVDDLDRLSAEEMVEGLDAIRIFIDIPIDELPTNCGLVFIISCDEERVAEALSSRSKRSPNMPGTISNLGDARRYLDRIFQFRLEIHPIPRRDMRKYAKAQLDKFPELENEITATGIRIEQLIDRMMHIGVENPRNALQILNAFLHSWWLAKERESESISSGKAGLLRSKSVTGHPISLAALSVLKVNFPEFYQQLQITPDLLKAYVRLVLDHSSIDDESLVISEAINPFISTKEDNEIVAADRKLRMYIASIRDIHWPRSLKPLLLLTEDDLSARLGDRAEDVKEALVSGDTQGALEAFGRQNDDKKLTFDDCELLKDILDTLTSETDNRRNLASKVTAELLPRLPESEIQHLVARLARRLYESLQLRSQFGLTQCQSVCGMANSDDCSRLVSRLCIDILIGQDEQWIFKTSDDEVPQLDVAVDWAIQVCELGLSTWQDIGLLPDASQAVTKWLTEGLVSVGSNSRYDLPFVKYEEWISRYKNILLPELSEDFIEKTIRHLESEKSIAADQSSLKLLETELVKLKKAGSSSATRMWEYIERLLAVKDCEANNCAWDLFSRYPTDSNNEQFCLVVSSLAIRLNKEMKDDKNWGLDWEAGAKSLLSGCESRESDLSQSTLTDIAELVKNWSGVNETSSFAIRGANILFNQSPNILATQLSVWISDIRSSTNAKLIEWMADNFNSKLSEDQQAALVSQLHYYVNSESIETNEGEVLKLFFDSLSDEGFKQDAVISLYTTLFDRLVERYNKTKYIEPVFPAMLRVIDMSPVSRSGKMLRNLFNQAKGEQAIYGSLHGWMVGHWPKVENDNYNPLKLFSDGAAFIEKYPENGSSIGILRSMNNMLKSGLVPSTQEDRIAKAACILWSHNLSETALILQNLSTNPPSSAIAKLTNEIGSDSEDEYSLLHDTWAHFATQMDDAVALEVASQILNEDLHPLICGKDGAFHAWCEAAKGHRIEFLKQLVISEETNDAIRHRVWLEIESRINEFNLEILSIIIFSVLSQNDSPDTVNEILRWSTESDNVFVTEKEKALFCEKVAPAYFKSNSLETRESIANWISRFNGISYVSKLRKENELSDDDKAIMKKHFPRMRFHKK